MKAYWNLVKTLLKLYLGIVFKDVHPLNKLVISVTFDAFIPGASIKDEQY